MQIFILRIKAPRAVCVLPADTAAILKAVEALLITLLLLVLKTFSPILLLAGLKYNREEKCFSDLHCGIILCQLIDMIVWTVSVLRQAIVLKYQRRSCYSPLD